MELNFTLYPLTKALKFLVKGEKFKRAKNLTKDLGNLIMVTIDRNWHKNGIYFHEI